MTHISEVVAKVSADLCRQYAKAAIHALRCPFWDRIDPSACNCPSRPMIDLLLTIAKGKAT